MDATTGSPAPLAHPPTIPTHKSALTWQDRLAVEVKDVGFLRHLWHNFAQIAPGVYRSNHPGHRRLKSYADMGIKAVLNLRGTPNNLPQLLEKQSCAELGMQWVSVAMSARSPASRTALLELFNHFDTLPRPFLMHCKSGADRVGLASALYLLDQCNADIDTARAQLSFRFLHIRRSETGVLDHILDVYANRCAQSPIPIHEWVAHEYDSATTRQSFETLRNNGQPA